MKIAGLQKTTLLDYPGRVACTIFLGGCNFRCPFCQNAEILDGSGGEDIPEAELYAFLEKRRGILDGACISGGEPLLSDVAPLLRRLKELGYAVKIDTNGCFPEKLKALYAEGLIDFAAMDIKNSPQKYAKTAGAAVDMKKIEESAAFLSALASEVVFPGGVMASMMNRKIDTIPDLLLYAISTEKDSILFYMELVQNTKVPENIPVFQQIIQEEKRHLFDLQRMLEETKGEENRL